MLVLVALVFLNVNFDAERLEEFQVLVVDLEFRIGGQGRDQRSLIGRFFALLADADSRFENQEDVVSTLLDAGDN